MKFFGTPLSIFAAIFPWLANIFTKLEQQKTSYSLLCDEIQSLIEVHKKSFDAENPRDLIDHWLVRVENDKESGNDLNEEKEDEMLRTLIIDIFIVS